MEDFAEMMAQEYGTESFHEQVSADWSPREQFFATLRARGIKRILRDARDGYRMARDSRR